ncbi:carbohydrate ABC transporter membrane protein 2, CUT1 family [Thermaerobacter marianensis DSM 12885]|uniref:Carbohydrate ABC transporter membrane protein 2, CUT1 family n=1 Tax=Thermaerobacter marianensis (strain ATCC 700841 / DSM 12885 / JCM 10246 / 7p75a) TaxID=644966 RepID=E6SIN9_THEM7|nr:carbohydrate ABC transporter permease [Thermaerobacter marianensis]ADU51983.1 carbohydrate ABC transporter membrane protein 2, CUT1 family [Thermaerobacter marianensis DSM 12885]
MKADQKVHLKALPWHLVLIVACGVSLLPIAWMVGTAFKFQDEIFTSFLSPIPHRPTLSNFLYVWDRIPFARYFFNSLVVAALVTAAQLVTATLAAYGFTQFRFPGREFLFYAVVASMLVPVQVTMLPNYLVVARLGWLDSYAGLMAPHLAEAMGIFLLRQAFRSVPASLVEAARLEGATHLQVIRKVFIPNLRPVFIALGILVFINTWNEYLWPLLIIKDENMFTLPLALQLFVSEEGGTSWGPMMAAATLAALPPLLAYWVAQRYVVQTFLSAGIKG